MNTQCIEAKVEAVQRLVYTYTSTLIASTLLFCIGVLLGIKTIMTISIVTYAVSILGTLYNLGKIIGMKEVLNVDQKIIRSDDSINLV
jgi:hypothetical protein